MSMPNETQGEGGRELQFDRAEYATKAVPGQFCRSCRSPIRDQYYDAGGGVICPACYATTFRGRGRLLHPLKALLLGSLAAAVGAGVYRMIMFGTGRNFVLVAILIGYMIGGAVKTGSGDRGGRFYQLLAVFLTYSALVGMVLPEAWEAIASASRERREARKAIEKESRGNAKAQALAKAELELPENPFQPAADAPMAGSKAEPKAERAVLEVNIRPEDLEREQGPMSLLLLLFALVVLIGLIYSAPVLFALHSPISLLIFGFAFWMAWTANRAVEPPVTGPYRLGA
jgi:hypothetical protein